METGISEEKTHHSDIDEWMRYSGELRILIDETVAHWAQPAYERRVCVCVLLLLALF